MHGEIGGVAVGFTNGVRRLGRKVCKKLFASFISFSYYCLSYGRLSFFIGIVACCRYLLLVIAILLQVT